MTEAIQVEGIQLDESMSPTSEAKNFAASITPLDSGCQTPTYAPVEGSELTAISDRGIETPVIETGDAITDVPSFVNGPSAQLRAVTLGQPSPVNREREVRLGFDALSSPYDEIRPMPARPQRPTPLQRAFTEEGDGAVMGAVGFSGVDDGMVIGRSNALEERNRGKVSNAETAVRDNLLERVACTSELVSLYSTLQQKRNDMKSIVERLPLSIDAIEEKERALVLAQEEIEQEHTALRDLLLSFTPLDVKAAQRVKFSLRANREAGTLILKSPKGPVNLVSAPQGPAAILRWRFRVTEGSSWAIGIIPISKAKDPKYLYDHGTVGLNNSDTRRSATFDRQRLQDRVVEIILNPKCRSVHIYIEDDPKPTLFEDISLEPEGMCLCLCTFMACNVELHQDHV